MLRGVFCFGTSSPNPVAWAASQARPHPRRYRSASRHPSPWHRRGQHSRVGTRRCVAGGSPRRSRRPPRIQRTARSAGSSRRRVCSTGARLPGTGDPGCSGVHARREHDRALEAGGTPAGDEGVRAWRATPDVHVHPSEGDVAFKGPELERLIAAAKADRAPTAQRKSSLLRLQRGQGC